MPLHRFTYYWQYRDRSVISNNCFGCHELNYIFEAEYFFYRNQPFVHESSESRHRNCIVLKPITRVVLSAGATCKNTLTSLGIKKGTDFSSILVDALFSSRIQNPDIETALFWNQSPEWFNVPVTRILINNMLFQKCPHSCRYGQIRQRTTGTSRLS